MLLSEQVWHIFLKKFLTRFKKNCASHNDRQRFTTLTLQGGRKMLINWENKSPFVFTTHGSGSPKKRFVRQGRQSYVVSLSLCVFRQDRFTWHYCRLYFLIYKLVNSVFFPCTSSYTKRQPYFCILQGYMKTHIQWTSLPPASSSSCYLHVSLEHIQIIASPTSHGLNRLWDYEIHAWNTVVYRLRERIQHND